MNTPETVPGTAAAMEASRKALGRAVHPRAWQRLHELWPLAVVEVTHGGGQPVTFPKGSRAKPVPRYPRWTVVRIVNPADGDSVHGKSTCSRGDQFDRRRGIDIAFRRALKQIPR